MNEINNEQSQKPKISKLTIAALIAILIIFIICINWPSSHYQGRRLPTNVKCGINLILLRDAITDYAMDNDGSMVAFLQPRIGATCSSTKLMFIIKRDISFVKVQMRLQANPHMLLTKT